jgi:hypothetical protein
MKKFSNYFREFFRPASTQKWNISLKTKPGKCINVELLKISEVATYDRTSIFRYDGLKNIGISNYNSRFLVNKKTMIDF